MIKILKFFLIISFIIIPMTWLSTFPGEVKILWKNYFVETSIIFLVAIILILSFFFGLLYYSYKVITSYPRTFKLKRDSKKLLFVNESLTNLTKAIVSKNLKNIDSNVRKLNKNIGNNIFSSYILAQSAISENDLDRGKKYLNLLLKDEKAEFIGLRGLALIALKEKNKLEAQKFLEKAQKLEPKNFWVSKQLSLLFAQSNQWDQANKALENIKNANEALESRAIFLLQSGGNPADAWNISKNSVPIAIKAIKYFLLENKEKKAYDIIAKSWNRLQHIDMIKAFIYQEKPSVKTSLRRFKLLQKALKPSLRYDETNLGMALASLDASMWGETKKYLERIKKENWDERVAKIWIELRTKSDKIEIPEIPKKLKSEPKWYCENCKTQTNHWSIKCQNCGEIGSINWSKSIKIEKKSFKIDELI